MTESDIIKLLKDTQGEIDGLQKQLVVIDRTILHLSQRITDLTASTALIVDSIARFMPSFAGARELFVTDLRDKARLLKSKQPMVAELLTDTANQIEASLAQLKSRG